jgi:hypothetical protein
MRVTLIALAVSLAACDVDGPKPGVREPCSTAAGPLQECERVELMSAADACWRLVECGAIPIANPEADPECCFDWTSCVDYIEELPDPQYELTLACLEAATCDELKWNGSPNRPNDELAPCLDQGN